MLAFRTYPIIDSGEPIPVSKNAKIFGAFPRDGIIHLVTLVDPAVKATEPRRFKALGPEASFEDRKFEYLATVHMQNGFTWHVIETFDPFPLKVIEPKKDKK